MSHDEITVPPLTTARPAPATPTEDLITALLGTLVVAGGTLDGWAHNNILAQIQGEGFFTPWHAVLYTGYGATAAWTFWIARRRRRPGTPWWSSSTWPVGYRMGALGVVLFGVAGGLDMVWHEIFGIEVTLDALLSPSHLLLAVGSVLMVTSPLRSWWSTGEGGLRTVAGVLSLALGATVVQIFTLYTSTFNVAAAASPYDGLQGTPGYVLASLGLAGYLVSTAVILVPVLLVHRRGTVPGLITAVVVPVALFAPIVYEFPAAETTGAVTAIVAAGVADVLVVRLDLRRGLNAPLRLPIAGAVVGALVSAGHLLGVHLDSTVRWPAELWTGAVVSAAIAGAVLGALAARPVPAGEAVRW
jgi:hypothetical protein